MTISSEPRMDLTMTVLKLLVRARTASTLISIGPREVSLTTVRRLKRMLVSRVNANVSNLQHRHAKRPSENVLLKSLHPLHQSLARNDAHQD